MRDQVFISYSHQDAEWMRRLQVVLKPLMRKRVLNVWADDRIRAGEEWRKEIQEALEAATVAVLLVSPDFLASEFIAEHELPPLLKAAKENGLSILWVPIRHSLYFETDIAKYQAAHDPKRPLSGLTPSEADGALVEISQKIKECTMPAAPAEPDPPDPPVKKRKAKKLPVVAPVEEVDEIDQSEAPPLNEVLPGHWQVQIQSPMPGVVGQMQLQLFPHGVFHGQLMSPMGSSVVDGAWQVNPLMRQIGLQGQQSNGFQVGPYFVMLQVTQYDREQVSAMSSNGEQVTMRRTG
jgi:hypothetical protein